MTALGAPDDVIEKYRAADSFELFECCVDAWQVVMLLSPADFAYSERQQGKKTRMVFAGYKTPAVCAIIATMNIKHKRQAGLLQRVRLIEYGAMQEVD